MALKIDAYQFSEVGEIREALTGDMLPEDYAGHCIVFFNTGDKMIFQTGIEEGERFWSAIGNPRKMEYKWGTA